MFVVFVIIAVVLVFAIAAASIGAVVGRLADQPSPTVLHVDQAVDWIAERLPFEVSAELSHRDVANIIGWHLDYFSEVGLASTFGQEIGGEAVPVSKGSVVASTDDAVDFVVGRALAEGDALDPVHVVVVIDLHEQYWREIGAIGPEAPPPGGGA